MFSCSPKRWGIPSVPTASYLGFHFPFILLTHLSGHLAYLQPLMLILFVFNLQPAPYANLILCSLSAISATFVTVWKFYYASQRKLHTLSLCWSNHSHLEVKCVCIIKYDLAILKNIYLLSLVITNVFTECLSQMAAGVARVPSAITQDNKEKFKLSGQCPSGKFSLSSEHWFLAAVHLRTSYIQFVVISFGLFGYPVMFILLNRKNSKSVSKCKFIHLRHCLICNLFRFVYL